MVTTAQKYELCYRVDGMNEAVKGRAVWMQVCANAAPSFYL
jgi:hypothetical protein